MGKNENWERFLPHFKKRNVQTKKSKKIIKKKKKDVFPPQQQPRKEDIMMETGEYFLDERERKQRNKIAKFAESKAKSLEKKKERAKAYEAPSHSEAVEGKKRKRQEAASSSGLKQESSMEMADRLVKS